MGAVTPIEPVPPIGVSAASARVLVVVFGAAVRPDGSASPALARRVGYAAAAALADSRIDLFLSGGVGRYPPDEATVMADLLGGTIAAERQFLDPISADTLQTVRAAVGFARQHGYGEIRACTDAYHQPRVRMLFAMAGWWCRPVRMVARGPRKLQARMWAREVAAIPYDVVAGLDAIWFRKRK